MIRGTVSAALLMLVASPALADERLVEKMFSENEVVRVDGKTGVQATIAFGDGEAIENVAVGDSQAWQITPNKRADLLFVKPLDGTARTNMTVVTNRHTYFFDLVASTKAKPLYMLKFRYKDEPKASGGTLAAGLDPNESAVLGGDVPTDPAALNFAWKRTGDAKIQPSRVYDDGNATYLLWPEKSAVPAILMVNDKGEEGPVNYAVRGSTIVIGDVPKLLVLRAGRARASLENQRPAAAPAAPAVAEIVRPAATTTAVVTLPGDAPAIPPARN